MEQIFKTQSPAETHALGRKMAGELRRGDCLALVGCLGAGKTVFVRGLAEGLGCDAGLVSSPTYVLVQEYPTRDGLSLFHIDVYRLSEPEAELADLGLEEMLEAGVVVIEWADRVQRALPRAYLRLSIDIDGEASRRFTLTNESA
ncbi:MAG: tRNA (adenosine(37)-N6)-threonylcarbamoyltransferase complex ATPase subunit type 1 TsaE [Phycisphaerae bacterium]|nr:tRNA (adenosine(37)-N6)-threonylcarbamoyltransferase complex ATPase subunit type 1 TsaE [Phycisphaerae bacterium]